MNDPFGCREGRIGIDLAVLQGLPHRECGGCLANWSTAPLNFVLTGGHVHDSQVVAEVLEAPRAPLLVAADKAYDSEKARRQIADDGAVPAIPSRSNATKAASRTTSLPHSTGSGYESRAKEESSRQSAS